MHHVYVAGSSREIPRVREAMRLLRDAGLVVIGDWTLAVERFGTAGTGLTDEDRANRAAAQLDHVSEARAVVVLWPETPSVRAFVELGSALTLARSDRDDRPAILIVGGESLWHPYVRGLFFRHLVLGDTFATVEGAIEWMRHEMHVCGEWPDAETVARMTADGAAQEAGAVP